MRMTAFRHGCNSPAQSSIGRRLGFAAAMLLLLTSPPARADIYQWQWVDPSDPSQGVEQSGTLCPGGAGVSAVPSAALFSRDLTQAYLIGVNMQSGFFYETNLTNADLSGANLTYTCVQSSTLTGKLHGGHDSGSKV